MTEELAAQLTLLAELGEALAGKFGMAYDNPDFLLTPLRLPFGGRGESGWIIENLEGQMTKREGAFIYSAKLVRG
jgi:hypothetical protein